MKKLIFTCVAALTMAAAVPGNIHAKDDEEVRIFLDGKIFISEEREAMVENRVMIPVKEYSEQMGYSVLWNDIDRTVTIEKGEDKLVIAIGSDKVDFNGKLLTMHTKAYIEKDKTYVPIRFLGETFGKEVQWDNKNRVVIAGDYRVNEELSNYYVYHFPEGGYSLKIPDNLEDRLVLEKNEDVLTFVEKSNGEGEYGGVLLSIVKYDNASIMDIVPSRLLKYEKGTYYIASFASDVQYDPQNEELTKNYKEVSDISKEILKSFQLVEDVSIN